MRFFHSRPPEGLSAISRLTLALMAFGVILLLFVVVLLASSRARVVAIRTGLGVAGAEIPRDARGQTNVLLLGVGDKDHDAADLTDTMIFASIDPLRTRSVVLLSLPRDLYIDKAGDMRIQGRINTIYFYERELLERQGVEKEEASRQALRAVGDAIGEKLGVSVHGVFKADFTALENVVDALGGVEVDVPEAIVDYYYPVAEGRSGTFRIDAGPQHLDGKTALMYARSRHSTSDFDRSARQQQLIAALGAKARSLGRFGQMTFLPRLYRSLTGHVETTMSSKEVIGLAQIGMELSLDRVVTMQLNYNTGGDGAEAAAGGFVTDAPREEFGGASVLLPFSLSGNLSDWSQIRTFVQLLTGRRDVYLAQPRVYISNISAKLPQAQRLRNELLRYGFDVAELGKQRLEGVRSFSGSFIAYDEGRFQPSARLLGSLTGLPVAKASGEEPHGSGDLLILLGSEYLYQPFQTFSGSAIPANEAL